MNIPFTIENIQKGIRIEIDKGNFQRINKLLVSNDVNVENLYCKENFLEDYSRGTMKFSLMTPIKKGEFIVGKFLFIALYALIFLVVGFIGSYMVGTISFGLGAKREFLNTFINNLKDYASVLLPLISFSTVITFIALIVNNSGATITLGIGIDIIMIVIDQMKNMVYYTFSGGMYAPGIVNNLRPNSTLIFSFTSIIYIVIFMLLSIIIAKKKDIVL
ncbi:ABC transporter permease [Clostridium sp. Marseille-Q2269]|uniref:ABC transporter permease n=1 Tax=Clostridium sp. Marseille-Q2269 TaxID=2942205 RepID=UPI0020732318|nr:ABC transporter permease [Clostridium sp. Marseille-Q2269]